jgi:hypothetical protein
MFVDNSTTDCQRELAGAAANVIYNSETRSPYTLAPEPFYCVPLGQSVVSIDTPCPCRCVRR